MLHRKRILAIDIGAGTQDILLFEEDASIENSVQLVLPSPTVQVARQIRRATDEGHDIYLTGGNDGRWTLHRGAAGAPQEGTKAMATPRLRQPLMTIWTLSGQWGWR